ncbi:DUF2723 domain-containing protein, partial [Patescibacteria group bacterium]|nr:DUF2723 domain-containing protein [Patescibacteria group bacterium]
MRKNILTAIILGLIAFVAYLLTMPASVYTGDSGEIATAVATWGIAHPTGFPVYLVLGKLFSYLVPFWEFAFKLNIFSAFTGAATVGILFLILQKIKINYWISVAVSLSLAFAHTFWSHATVVRVYGLSAMFFALAIYFLLSWLEENPSTKFRAGKSWQLYLLAIICGFGAGTHLTFFLIFPFILIFVFVKDKKLFSIKKVVIFGVLFLIIAGIVYSYIPLRASQSPELNWGDPSTKQSFINYITQKDYAGKIGTRGYESWILMTRELGSIFTREFTFVGLVLVLAGLIVARKKYREWFWAGLAVITFNILLLANYGNSEDIIILYRYFLPSYIMMAVFIAIAIQKAKLLDTRYPIVLLLPVFIFAFNFQDLNRHNYTLVEDTAKNILESVPQNSILITSGDTLTGAIMYEQIVLENRTDLVVIDNKLFTHDNYRKGKKNKLEEKNMVFSDSFSELIEKNQKSGVYVIDNSYFKKDFDVLSGG